MENIIITVTNQSKTYLYDLEVPTNITLNRLRDDVIETLNGYNPNLFSIKTETVLFSNRIGRQLMNDETLESAGVWNGDYITIIEV